MPASVSIDSPSVVASSYSNGKQNGAVAAAVTKMQLDGAEQIRRVLITFRCFIADLCQQFNGGHPGSAMGMAAIGVALWKYTMRYSPLNPQFFNRDRFVLSNGHTCLFQYTFLHLVGYKNFTIDQLLSYHSKRDDSICAGHPEIEADGIEVTTGPLGQGIANAVGMAMAEKHLSARYNRPGFPIVSNTTWCMIGDACLQEGVALEAIQLAGHWKLNNLVVIYDNNQITCDGSVDLCNTEDVNSKMRACGWDVIEIEDGSYDVEGIVVALQQARESNERPTFINVRTVIGVGSKFAGDAKAHGAALGADNVADMKRSWDVDPAKNFEIPAGVYDYFRSAELKGKQLEREWEDMLAAYAERYPEMHEEFCKRVRGEMVGDWQAIIPNKESLPTTPTPSRKSAGLVCNPLAEKIPNFMVGTADLSPSVNMIWKSKLDFQHPALRTECGINGNYTGRYIHWGVREHAMASISNGLAAYNKGSILPVTSSFFMFYLYAAPGVRMGALQGLQAIHIATHDSIGTGEDGPTHQPIELAALYRAMPNLQYVRPCDSEETAGAFIAALSATNSPTILSLSRQNLDQYPAHSSRDGVLKGAYEFIAESDADVTLLGVGSEMCFAVRAREVLAQRYGIKARIVSFPSQSLFERQDAGYKRNVLQTRSNAPRVIIEAYAVNGWERYADAGYSMSSFGHSLPGAEAYKHFGFTGELIAERVNDFVVEVKSHGIGILRDGFRDLNKDPRQHSA